MNKKLLLILLAFTLSGVAWAQTVVIKPAAGINLTSLSRDYYKKKYSPQTGVQYGASVLIGKKFYAEPGLFYVRKNPAYSETLAIPLYIETLDVLTPYNPIKKATYRMSGFQVPLALGYRVIDRKNAPFFAGLRVFTGGSVFFLRRTDQTFYVNRTQWGLFAGAGVDLLRFLYLDARYERSLSDLDKESYGVLIGRSQSLNINLGVRLPVKKTTR